jgi:ubiquinone/menaquinone biosynthesis C-methylase UbiE
MPTAGWWEARWPEPANVLDQVGIAEGMDVVDLCSGDGWFTLQIATRARAVTSIEIDADFLQVAGVRLAEAGFTNCRFVEGNAYEVDRLVSRPADFVFMANAFPGVPDGTRLARER